MATKEELEQLRNLLQDQGIAPSTLTPEIAQQANVISATGAEEISPAGSVDRIPIFPMATRGMPATPQQLTAPTIERGEAAKPSFTQRIGSALQQINQFAMQPANREMMGQMAQAISGQYTNSVGAQLGRFAVQNAQDESEQALMGMAAEGSDPYTENNWRTGAVTAEGRQRVASEMGRLRAEGREERQLDAQVANIESTITAREAAMYNDQERLELDRVKVDLQAQSLDFAATEAEWKQQLAERRMEMEESLARSNIALNSARIEFQRGQTEALAQGRSISGSSGGGAGGIDDSLRNQRLATTLRTELQNYNQLYGRVVAAQDIVNSLGSKNKLKPAEQRQLQIARQDLATYEPQMKQQWGQITELMAMKDGDGADTAASPSASAQTSADSTIALAEALENRDVTGAKRAAAAAFAAGEITEQYYNEIMALGQ